MLDPTASSDSTATHPHLRVAALPQLSARDVLPWLVFAGLLLLVAGYFVSTEQGATSLLSGTAVHEWMHDGRHLLGFPCH